MPLSVRVDRETERVLTRLVRKTGKTKSEVIRTAIGAFVRDLNDRHKPGRPYDAVEDLIGCVRGGPPNLSVRTGEGFRRILLEKKARGHDPR